MQNALLHALVEDRSGRTILGGRIRVIAGGDRLTALGHLKAGKVRQQRSLDRLKQL